jgi:hypothetical protein
MANGKKRRKHKKRGKIKTESVLSARSSKAVNSLLAVCDSPAIMLTANKNFKHNRIAKSKGSTFVPPSCITSCCSTPSIEIIKPKIGFNYYQSPLIETTHIFNNEPTKVRRRKLIGGNTLIVPPSSLKPKLVSQSVNEFNVTYVKPIILEKAAEIIMPTPFARRKRKWFTGAPIVPNSCITNYNSVVKSFKPPRKFYYPPPVEHKPSPPIVGPERHFMRRRKRYGDNNVIVPKGCIIQPKPVNQVNSYDWRKAFPKPIALEKPADIMGPTIKFRGKKRYHAGSSFVPTSCIIVPNEIPPLEIKANVEEQAQHESEAIALEPESSSDSNLYLLVVAVVVAVIFFAFVFGR